MRNQARVGLVTLDLRFTFMVKKAAQEYHITVVHVVDSKELPLDIEVVIAKRSEGLMIDRGTILYMEDFSSVEELVERALEIALIGLKYKMAVAAIDPGKNLGAAYLLDNVILKTRKYGLVDDLVEDVEKFMRRHEEAERRYVIVGAASDFEIVKNILRKLESKLRGHETTIIVCDESFTSRGMIPKFKGMSKDEYSALILSLKNILRLE